MSTTADQIKLYKVDAAPVKSPSEVGEILDKFIDAVQDLVEVKAGELLDPSFRRHHSYFIGFRSRSNVPADQHAITTVSAELVRFCNSNRLPIIEMDSKRPELRAVLAAFAWE